MNDESKRTGTTFSTFATALSGSAVTGLAAAMVVPGVPLAVAVAAVAGALGSGFLAHKLDEKTTA